MDRYAHLRSIVLPTMNDNVHDTFAWADENDNLNDFSVSLAYKSLDGPHEVVPWYSLVWFKGHIPKHSFCLWLACLKRLPTQDRLFLWKHEPPDMKCSLCLSCMDSHSHLFF